MIKGVKIDRACLPKLRSFNKFILFLHFWQVSMVNNFGGVIEEYGDLNWIILTHYLFFLFY